MAIDLLPGAWVGRFVVTRPLGEGGMGTVVEAHDPELGRAVALKLLRDERGDAVRLLREAQALATLAHPNVVAVYELGTDRGEVFIAMELVDGATLEHVLAQRPHTWQEIVALFVQAGRGLAAVHARGLVHRDFKPSNVFVDRTGRARVGDFGLACRDLGPSAATTPGRAAAPVTGDTATDDARADTGGTVDAVDAVGATVADTPVPRPTPAPGGALAAPLTQPGAVMGTPRYMAPEQHAGAPATHLADQYAFCRSLLEALEATKPGAARGARRVPPWLRAIVDRGLSHAPAARHPSMTALLAAVERGLRRRRRQRSAAAIGAVTLTTAAAAFWLGSRGEDPRAAAAAACAASARDLDAVWDRGRAELVTRAFAASDVAHAAETEERVAALLDDYADRWKLARIEACRATHVRRAQSEAMLDLRVQCLDRRLDALAAVASALASPLEATAVDQAISVASRLPLIDDCAQPDQVQAWAPLPADPAERARGARLHRAVADVVAQYKLGRYADAEARLNAVVEDARDFAYPPLQSDLAYQRGWFAYRAGQPADAELAMGEALRFAVAARDLGREERAWRGLFILVSNTTARRPEAEQLRRADEMALARAGWPADEWAEHRNYVVLMHMNTGRLEEAERLARAAVAEVPLDRIWARGVALDQHARVLAMLHRSVEAIEVGREAVALWERALGTQHPKIANALASLARGYRAQGQLADADAALHRSLAVLIAAHGPDSVHLADTYKELARLGAERHDLDATRRAADAMLRVLAPLEQSDPENWINGQAQAGSALTSAGAPAEALPYLRRALERATAIGDHKDAAIAGLYLGQALNLVEQPREALRHCTAAEAPLAERFGTYAQTAAAQCRGDALLALGRAADAVEVLERVVVATAGSEPDPGDLAEVRFSLARARWASGDRAGALAVADEAALEWGDPRFAHELAALETWRRGKSAVR